MNDTKNVRSAMPHTQLLAQQWFALVPKNDFKQSSFGGRVSSRIVVGFPTCSRDLVDCHDPL